jgi:N-acetyl-anhydromuramyl-L-alanine amidase AmpD
MKITQYTFNKAQYLQDEYKKTQIYLHHTAGNANPYGVYKDWEKNEERVATCMVVGGKNTPDNSSWVDGEIIQGFASKHWAFHLGLKESTFNKYNIKYQSLDRISIGIEICNWGQLTLKEGKYYNYVNKEVPKEEVVELTNPHRGFKYYHAYTDAQIDAVEEILRILKVKFNIPIKYNPDIWDITTRALKGEPGVYTHNSVRTDKVDVSPQPKLIDMLKSLK